MIQERRGGRFGRLVGSTLALLLVGACGLGGDGGMPAEETATLRQVRGRAQEFGDELLVLLEEVPRMEWSLAAEVDRHREARAWDRPLTRMEGREWSLEELEALLVEQGPEATFVRDDFIQSERSAPTRYRFGSGWDERWLRWTWNFRLQMAGEESPELTAANSQLVEGIVETFVAQGWQASFDDRFRPRWTLLKEDVGGVWRIMIDFGSSPSMTFRIDSPEVFHER